MAETSAVGVLGGICPVPNMVIDRRCNWERQMKFAPDAASFHGAGRFHGSRYARLGSLLASTTLGIDLATGLELPALPPQQNEIQYVGHIDRGVSLPMRI
jgi:hypothetical protein